MKLGLIYLGRRGAGAPISYEIGVHLSQHAEVLAVLSDQLENLSIWERTSLELITSATYQSLSGAVWSWINQSRIKKLADQIRSWHPDVLLFPMFYTWNPFLQWRLREIPAVVAVHDPIPHPGLTERAYKILEDLSIRRAERCMVFSRELAPELNNRGVDLEHIDYVPLGELSYYQRYLSGLSTQVDDKAPRLLFFGRITAYKGIDVLLNAYKELHKDHNFELMIVGEGNMSAYRALLDDHPEIRIINHWVGEEDIALFFNQASIVILPYTDASQSGVVPIAASFGLPVIASRVGGIPEQIEHEKTGLLVEPGSISGLVEAARKLIENPAFARQLGENLQDDYREKRNWGKITQTIYEICEKAVGET